MEKKNKKEKRKRLLIVEDELGPRESLCIIFMDKYDVTIVTSGDAGMRHIVEHSPDLVILDLNMPGMNGLEVLENIRDTKPETKVIILTGYGSPETAQKAKQLGVNAYLNKPFDLFEIRHLVAGILNGDQT